MGQIVKMPPSVVYVSLSAEASPKTLAIDILNALGAPPSLALEGHRKTVEVRGKQ
jgi:hypothetical protein